MTRFDSLLGGLILSLTLILSACASSGGTLNDVTGTQAGRQDSRVSICKSGDTEVDSSQQCLQDDAACYPLSTGKWCTGERGTTCPAGSSPLPAQSACPPGNRCIRISESLECMVN